MTDLVHHLRRLSPAKRIAILLMVVIVLLTWLSVCVVLASSVL